MMARYARWVKREGMGDGTFCYTATHPELPGCRSQGDTPEEAIRNLDEAREMYLSALREAGLPIPPPVVVDGRGTITLDAGL